MSARTSVTHPLRIDEACPVQAGVAGIIGLTLCPGKWQRDAITGEWERDLATDLDAIKVWGAVAVASVMEEQEFSALRVQHIGTAIKERGMEWHHLPVPDVQPPGAAFENLWPESGARLRGHLAEGRRILVHCKGGLGRTGTVAALLLIELGYTAPEAIRIVRKSRPGAIETSEQESYLLRHS